MEGDETRREYSRRQSWRRVGAAAGSGVLPNLRFVWPAASPPGSPWAINLTKGPHFHRASGLLRPTEVFTNLLHFVKLFCSFSKRRNKRFADIYETKKIKLLYNESY